MTEPSAYIPHAPESEAAVLGAMLLDPSCITRVAPIVTAQSFHIPANNIVARALFTLHERRAAIDSVTAFSIIRDEFKADTLMGGAFYLSEILDRVATSANVEYHARVVAEKAAQRQLAKLAADLADSAAQPNADTVAILQTAEDSLKRIAQERRAGAEDALIVKSWNALDLIHADLPPPPCLLGKGVLYRNSLSILFGREGMGKSWLSLQLALAVARHEDFFGIKTTKVSTATAIFSLEMPDWQVKRRIQRLTEEMRYAGTECVSVVCREGLRTAMDLRDAKHVDAVIAHCIRTGAQLLVLDAMSRIHWSDENDAREMAIIIAAADRIRIEANVCVLILHHERKPQGGAKAEGVDSDHMAALRGSTVIPAGVHSGMRILPIHGQPVLVCGKANWGKKFEPVWLEQVFLPPIIGEDGEEEENGGWFKLGSKPADLKDHAARNRDAVLNFVAAAEFPVTAEEVSFTLALKSATGQSLKLPSIRGYLRALENEQLVISEGKTRDRRWRLNSFRNEEK